MAFLSKDTLREHEWYEGCARWSPQSCRDILEAIAEFGNAAFHERLKSPDLKRRAKAFLKINGCVKRDVRGRSPVLLPPDRSLTHKLSYLWLTTNFEDFVTPERVLGLERYESALSVAEISLGHACKIFSPNCAIARRLNMEPLLAPTGSVECSMVKQVRGLLFGSLICVSLTSKNLVSLFAPLKKHESAAIYIYSLRRSTSWKRSSACWTWKTPPGC